MTDDEHFRCDDCGTVLDDPTTAPARCECGGEFWRFVRAGKLPDHDKLRHGRVRDMHAERRTPNDE